ncbi:unnamed protein product [Urochloa humidicola]
MRQRGVGPTNGRSPRHLQEEGARPERTRRPEEPLPVAAMARGRTSSMRLRSSPSSISTSGGGGRAVLHIHLRRRDWRGGGRSFVVPRPELLRVVLGELRRTRAGRKRELRPPPLLHVEREVDPAAREVDLAAATSPRPRASTSAACSWPRCRRCVLAKGEADQASPALSHGEQRWSEEELCHGVGRGGAPPQSTRG